MKKLLFVCFIMMFVSVCFGLEINAIQILQTGHTFLINDTELAECQNELQAGDTITCGNLIDEVFTSYSNCEYDSTLKTSWENAFQAIKYLSDYTRNRYKTDDDNYYNEYIPTNYFNYKMMFHHIYSKSKKYYYMGEK